MADTIEKPKSQTQLRLEKLQAGARERAANSPITEKVIDIPSDVDEDRLAAVAKELSSDTPEVLIPPGIVLDKPSVTESFTGDVKIMVLSVTTIPYIPAKASNSDEAPQPTQKFNILVESPQPLQLGKTYQLKA